MIAVGLASSVVLLVIGLLIEPVAEQQQTAQMQNLLTEAITHDGLYPLEDLASHLAEPGISIVIDDDGQTYTNGLLADIIITNVQLDGNHYVEMSTQLPESKATITVAAIRPSIYEMWAPIFAIGVPTILVTLMVVMIALQKATKIALQPLDDMTSLATEIAEGQSGKRLEVSDPSTELGRTAVAFDKMLDSLEANLNRAKQAESRLRQLCADVAHELRSPLATIVASADNLMRNTSSKNQRELAENTALSVVRDGQRAARIVGDLTLAAQLDIDELASRQMIFQRTDLVQLVQDSVKAFENHSSFPVKFTSKLKLNKKFQNVDPHRIQQILNNLLENANRYAKSLIEVTAERDATTQEIVIQVFNDGIEVPEAMSEKIFERFVRLDESRDRAQGGSGLGLFISRSLAEAHSGSLKNIPTAGGAKFELRLPILDR